MGIFILKDIKKKKYLVEDSEDGSIEELSKEEVLEMLKLDITIEGCTFYPEEVGKPEHFLVDNIVETYTTDKEKKVKVKPDKIRGKKKIIKLQKCSSDFTYFIGKDTIVEINNPSVLTLAEKDELLKVLDTLYNFKDISNKAISLYNNCIGVEKTVQICTEFSEELKVDTPKILISINSNGIVKENGVITKNI